MPRAIRRTLLGSLAAGLLWLGTALAQPPRPGTETANVPIIDAIGMVDRSGPPTFKIGTWVKYASIGESESGIRTDYELTVAIAGEEVFWGEDCFWLETGTNPKGSPPTSVATLMSYALFDKSLPEGRVSYFQRKTIMDMDKDGKPIQTILKRAINSLRSKEKRQGFTTLIDTLGTETITTPKGVFECIKVREESGIGATSERGDSTRYSEHREIRTTYLSTRIPITGLVRTDIEVTVSSKMWKVGYSSDVPMRVEDRAKSRSELVDFGEGRVADLIPEVHRRPIRKSATVGTARK